MKILVNYLPSEKGHLSQLAYHLRQHNLEAVSSSATMTIGELQQKAKLAGVTAILICNEYTLRNIVPGNEPTLDKYRGSRLNFPVPAIVTNSLAHINTVPHGEWLLNKDLEKFKYLAIAPATFTYEVLDNPVKFSIALSNLSKAILISYDIETRLFNEDEDSIEAGTALITCASWTGLMPDGTLYTVVLPLIDFDVDHWEKDEDYVQALEFLRVVNKLPQPKVMQNGMYDSTHSIRYHAEPYNYILDTIGFAHSQYSELPKTLDFIASYQLYDYVFWKDDAEEASKKRDIRKYWAYNAKDSWNTMRILLQQLRTMPAYAYRNYAEQFKLTYPFLYCSFEGIKIDNKVRGELRAEASIKLESALTKLRIMFADPNFNPGSWQQVSKYIYDVFGAKKPKIGKSKSCTDEKNLLAVAQQHPLLAKLTTEIISYREAQKAIGTYFDFKQINSRLLYAIDPFGTETSRAACRASSLWAGTQVQNIPFYAKQMLVADEGYEKIEIDNSQSEARCTAYCAQELELIKALENAERDFYKTLGTLFFQMNYEDVTDFFRNKVLKKIVHGTNYMMGAKTFIENIGIQILYETASSLGIRIVQIPKVGAKNELTLMQFAKQLLDAYHKPFPRVRRWYQELFDEINATHMLKGPLGNVRYFFGNISKDHNMLRGAVAHQPQNLSVTILNRGLWKVYKQLVIPSNGEFRLKAQVHDSILAQYLKTKRNYYASKMQELMYNPVEIHGRTLIIPTDIKVGDSWGTMNKYKPEKG